MKKRRSYKRGGINPLWIVLLIIILIVVIGTIIFLVTTYTTYNSYSPDKDSYKQVQENAVISGEEYCSKVNPDFKSDCLKIAITSLAKTNKDPNYCSRLVDNEDIRTCKKLVIYPLVARAYKIESEEKNNPELIPSNIDLCNKLDNSDDKNYCNNPKQIVLDCGGVFCY